MIRIEPPTPGPAVSNREQCRVTVERCDVREIYDLRHRVLRAGLAFESARFEGDDESTAVHLRATQADDPDRRVVGCCSIVRRPWTRRAGLQLRGMAVEPDHRGLGIGAALLEAATRHAQTYPEHVFWCNARLVALGFYLRHGWHPVGRVFEIPTAGPHYRMIRPLTRPSVVR